MSEPNEVDEILGTSDEKSAFEDSIEKMSPENFKRAAEIVEGVRARRENDSRYEKIASMGNQEFDEFVAAEFDKARK